MLVEVTHYRTGRVCRRLCAQDDASYPALFTSLPSNAATRHIHENWCFNGHKTAILEAMSG